MLVVLFGNGSLTYCSPPVFNFSGFLAPLSEMASFLYKWLMLADGYNFRLFPANSKLVAQRPLFILTYSSQSKMIQLKNAVDFLDIKFKIYSI